MNLTDHSDDFGPPRRCSTIESLAQEVERQNHLADAGYLRRGGGQTWAWSKGDMIGCGVVWFWQNASHTYLPCEYNRFEDHEKAWETTEALRERIRW